ncbi:restriction endonuclease subunit S [Lacticaseibacillus paracasei]|uniref:restriction endonuclease subunit S n=1 Tax=Lacticaseibacillus paracasei TaxID=1597 RepID=UPI0035CED7E4|nr:restriction endonuclease subunit S [Lacticaseibacillus paracasei]
MAEFGCLYSEVLLTRNAWEKRKLGEVATITMGQSPDSKNYTLNPQDHILVQGNADIKNGWVEPRVWTTQITKIAKKGSVLLSVRAPVGEVSKTAFDVVLGRGVASVGQTDFLYQYLITLKINGFWLRYSTGSTFDSINSADIKDAIIFLPEKNEQSRIAKTLNCIDNLIAATQHKIDALEQIKEKLSQNLFDQSWRFKEYSTPWKENKLKDIVSAYSGGTPSANIRTYYGGHIPFIRSAEIHSSTTALTLTQEGLQNSSAKLVKTGDILYALYGANSGDVDRSKINGAINQAILAMRPSKENDPNFILFQLMRMKDKIVSTYLQGGQGNLSGRLILALNLDMPESTLEQRTIGRLLQLLCELIGVNQSKYSQLELLKKSLLQNLFV